MRLEGLHLLLSYRCVFECDHCFVFGGPGQTGCMTLAQIREIIRQGTEIESIEWIYFEGGEPFLYYPILEAGVRMAKSNGFRVGLVTNAYWATSEEDAVEWLRPFVGMVEDLSVSCDLYHADEKTDIQTANAAAAAEELKIPVSLASIAQPDVMNNGKVPAEQSPLRYRGRAAETLASKARLHSWEQFTECPYEDLLAPSRVHLDPLGYIHVCQGITAGNLFNKSLKEIVTEYKPEADPVIGKILEGGPTALYQPDCMEEEFADACHLCFSARKLLRKRHPETLAPLQMYG